MLRLTNFAFFLLLLCCFSCQKAEYAPAGLFIDEEAYRLDAYPDIYEVFAGNPVLVDWHAVQELRPSLDGYHIYKFRIPLVKVGTDLEATDKAAYLDVWLKSETTLASRIRWELPVDSQPVFGDADQNPNSVVVTLRQRRNAIDQGVNGTVSLAGLGDLLALTFDITTNQGVVISGEIHLAMDGFRPYVRNKFTVNGEPEVFTKALYNPFLGRFNLFTSGAGYGGAYPGYAGSGNTIEVWFDLPEGETFFQGVDRESNPLEIEVDQTRYLKLTRAEYSGSEVDVINDLPFTSLHIEYSQDSLPTISLSSWDGDPRRPAIHGRYTGEVVLLE